MPLKIEMVLKSKVLRSIIILLPVLSNMLSTLNHLCILFIPVFLCSSSLRMLEMIILNMETAYEMLHNFEISNTYQ